MPEGLKVRFRHERRLRNVWAGHTYLGTYWDARRDGLESQDILPQGGTTTCRLVSEDGAVVAEGVAVCSRRDNYCKRLGRDVSLGRALNALKASENARGAA